MANKLVHLVLFLLGLLGTAAGILSVDPLPFWSWARSKLGYLEREIDRYDTIFLGSSRVHYGVNPATFDQRMAELGVPATSYNLALSGQRPHDFDEMVRWLLARRPARLKRVIIELCSWELDYREGDWMGVQEIEMRTAHSFLPRCGSILHGRLGWFTKLSLSWHHVAHTLVNVLRIGQGTRILDDRFARWRGEPFPMVYPPPNAGFSCVEDVAMPHQKVVHDQFVANPVAAMSDLEARIQIVAPDWLAGGFCPEILRAEAAALRTIGVEPIYVVMPSICSDFFGRKGVEAIRGEVRLLELDRPQAHRPLYEFPLWYDKSHVGRQGAERLSKYLADCVVQVEQQPPGQPSPPRWVADAPPTLRAVWLPGATALQLQAHGLPFGGKVLVMVSLQPGETLLGEGIEAKVALPPAASCELQSSGLGTAAATLDAAALPKGVPLFAQLGVWIDGKVVAASDGVRIDPPQ
jgi:hypothetical protein